MKNIKIAVIGSGISGLSSAYYLSKYFKVDLFEKNNYFGGHTHTQTVNDGPKKINVDDNVVDDIFFCLVVFLYCSITGSQWIYVMKAVSELVFIDVMEMEIDIVVLNIICKFMCLYCDNLIFNVTYFNMYFIALFQK